MFGLGRVTAEVRGDLAAARSRDPAAAGVSTLEILATWPGVHAILSHRFAHALYEARTPLLPRAIAARRGPTPTGSIYPTRLRMRSRDWPAGSPRSSRPSATTGRELKSRRSVRRQPPPTASPTSARAALSALIPPAASAGGRHALT